MLCRDGDIMPSSEGHSPGTAVHTVTGTAHKTKLQDFRSLGVREPICFFTLQCEVCIALNGSKIPQKNVILNSIKVLDFTKLE